MVDGPEEELGGAVGRVDGAVLSVGMKLGNNDGMPLLDGRCEG